MVISDADRFIVQLTQILNFMKQRKHCDLCIIGTDTETISYVIFSLFH